MMPRTAPGPETETAEMESLLDGIRRHYGYDFTHYSRASLKRRIDRARDQARLPTYAALLEKITREERCFDDFLRNMSITVTEMFRDPLVYKVIREKIAPVLKTCPFVKIWHAGCATGEEVYSMAIVLQEEGLLDRVRIYATDFNIHALGKARDGVYPAGMMKSAAAAYEASGGRGHFSDYITADDAFVTFREYLKKRVTFAYHNLVTDGVFGAMNMIFCRNVLIYFDRVLQDQVLFKLADSLNQGGFLCLGSKEALNAAAVKQLFEAVDAKQRIFKKGGDSRATDAGGQTQGDSHGATIRR